MAAVTVYALRDPGTGLFRYVGRTSQDLQYRLAQHVCHAKRMVSDYKADWIRRVGRPEIVGLVVVPDWYGSEMEARIIGALREEHPLLNLTRGGEGPSRYSAVTRRRLKEKPQAAS